MEYQIIRSRRKTISIQVTPRGEILVRCPSRMPKAQIQAFLESKKSWIEAHLPQNPPETVFTETELRTLSGQARVDISRRAVIFAPRVGVSYGRITIRSQHTRWGSCSAKGNLNFNCLLMLAPEYVRDYVVVHELCHRKQMNHSPAFWAEVKRVLPEYEAGRQWLKEHGSVLIARLP